jgi:hypothetical protein
MFGADHHPVSRSGCHPSLDKEGSWKKPIRVLENKLRNPEIGFQVCVNGFFKPGNEFGTSENDFSTSRIHF